MKLLSKNNPTINNIFRCPICHQDLKENQKYLTCKSKHRFFIKDKIYLFSKKPDNFYEGRFTNQSEALNFKNPFLGFIYKIWSAFSISNRHLRAFKEFAARFPKKKLVLDFGCGGGNKLFKKIGKVIGIDISYKSLQNAQKIYSKAILYDGKNLPFKDSTFDYVLSDQVFGHIPLDEKNQLIKEIYRIIKPGGIIYASIETDSKNNRLINFMKKYPKLYQQKWIRMYGHFGLELPSECLKRFENNGFEILKTFKGLRYFWEAAGYYKIFSKEYAEKNKLINFLVIISKPFAQNTYLGAFWSFIAGLLSTLLEKHLPLDSCTGIILYAKAKK